MVGTANDGTLILRLYPLEKNVPSGDDQKEKMLEIKEIGLLKIVRKGGSLRWMRECKWVTVTRMNHLKISWDSQRSQSPMLIKSLLLLCSKHHLETFCN